jgi:hypothetical protein
MNDIFIEDLRKWVAEKWVDIGAPKKGSAVSRKRAAGNTGPKPTNVATFTKRKKVNEGKVCPRGKAAAKRKFKVYPCKKKI